MKDRSLHQAGVQGGDTVDLVRSDKRKVSHAHVLAAVLADQRNRGQEGLIVRPVRAGFLQMQPVDVVDDLHVARQ